MNWQAINFDWNQVRAFLATAEEGSLSAAARVLSSTQPTLARQVSSLEDSLGVILFERGPRGLTLTETGQALLKHVKAMGDAASQVSLVAAGQSQEINGTVSVTAVDIFCVYFLIPILKPLRREAPNLSIKILPSNHVQDLMRREADIAVRHVRSTQQDVITKLAATMTGSFYASKSYLDEMGHAKTAEDMAKYDIIGLEYSDDLMQMIESKGYCVNKEQFRYPCDTGLVTLEMVRADLGVAILPDKMCETMPDLVRILPDMPNIEFPVWLAVHRELHTNRKIRVVFDVLEQQIKSL